MDEIDRQLESLDYDIELAFKSRDNEEVRLLEVERNFLLGQRKMRQYGNLENAEASWND